MAKVRRSTNHTFIRAECDTCGKVWTQANGHAVGAKHARAHGHYVWVDYEQTHIYDGTGQAGSNSEEE